MPECASKGRASSEHGQAIRELSDKKRRARLPGLGLLLQRTFRGPPGAPADARTPSSERACFLVVASSAAGIVTAGAANGTRGQCSTPWASPPDQCGAGRPGLRRAGSSSPRTTTASRHPQTLDAQTDRRYCHSGRTSSSRH